MESLKVGHPSQLWYTWGPCDNYVAEDAAVRLAVSL